MTTWYTADHHFAHKNIIKYCKRPYSTVEEMDADLIEQWNSVVRPDDIVYHLGDFTLSGVKQAKHYFSMLNGRIKILNIYWHHDHSWIRRGGECVSKSGFPVEILGQIEVVRVPEYDIDGYPFLVTMSHYPMGKWEASHYGAWHIHGHSHGTYDPTGNMFDVGVDTAYMYFQKYRPYNMNEIAKIISTGFQVIIKYK